MTTTPKLRVLLVETHPDHQRGSMARYAGLVQRALRETPGIRDGHCVSRLNLAFPWQWPSWMPANVQTWLNHTWLLLLGRFRIEKAKADLVHLLDGSYAYVLKGVRNTPAIATVHDLIPMIQQAGGFGQSGVSRLARVMLRKTRVGLQHCVRLVAVSNNTADDIAKSTTFPRAQIMVVPIALDPAMSPPEQYSKLRSRMDLTGEVPMILHVGNNGFYKNRNGVLRIFSRIAQHVPARLVMAGPEPTGSMRMLARELGLNDKVCFVIDPVDPDLVNLYREARLFLFPSLYEGFGWPPLEAMACGCPVVCSSAGSLPEVVGDAALTAPARDEEVLAQLCINLLASPELADEWVQKGRARAAQFTLDRMGQQLADAYTSVGVALRG